MTERWERSLRALGRVDPSEDVWRRAQEGPRMPGGPDLPPRRSRLLAGALAILVFLAAGAFAWRAFRPATTEIGGPNAHTIVATFKVVEGSQGGSGPSGTLTTPAGSFPGATSSFQWNSGNSSGNADVFGPPVTEQYTFTPVVVGSQLLVDSDAKGVTGSLDRLGNPDRGQSEPLYEYPTVVDFGTVTDPVTLDAPPGRYVLHLVPSWDQGTVNYFFPIVLVDPVSPPIVLTLRGTNAGPTASLTTPSGQIGAANTGYTWTTGTSSEIADAPTPEFDAADYRPIAWGSRLVIDSDANEMTGSLDAPGTYPFKTLVPFKPLSSSVLLAYPRGRYVLEVHATWDEGGTTYFYPIDLVRQGATLGSSRLGLTGTAWRVVSIDGVEVPAQIDGFTLRFGAKQLFGNDGCNGFGSSYELVGNSIHLGGNWHSTTAMCTGTASYQNRLMVLLGGTNTVTRTGARLSIESSSTAMTFERYHQI